MNDGIDPQLCTLSYARLDDAVVRALALGRGALLAKLDIQNAYRIIPVHPDDRGMRWQGSICLDAALPFGLRSAPKIFSAVADTLLWVMFNNGVTEAIHYLDDFFFVDHQTLTNARRIWPAPWARARSSASQSLPISWRVRQLHLFFWESRSTSC